MSKSAPERPAVPSRFDAVASLVPDAAQTLVDVGYDHGRVMLRFLEGDPDRTAIGVELQDVCAARFRRRYWRAASRIEFRTGSGLAPVAPGEADVAVVAGVGENTIRAVLADSPAVASTLKRAVLCPADFRATLVPALREAGWRVVAARLATGRRRFYEVLAVERGPTGPAADGYEAHFGHFEGDPALPRYLDWLRRKMAPAIRQAVRRAGTSPPRSPGPEWERWCLEDKLRAAAGA